MSDDDDTTKQEQQEKKKLKKMYQNRLNTLRNELMELIIVPQPDDDVNDKYQAAIEFLNSLDENESKSTNELDFKLCQFSILKDSIKSGNNKKGGLFEEPRTQKLIDDLLENTKLMKQMILADGPNQGQYGTAIEIYTQIMELINNKQSDEFDSNDNDRNILQRLAVAISLEHAVPIAQNNPIAEKDTAQSYIDPIKRFQLYCKAYHNGELDPLFDTLSVFELRHVINGDEPDYISIWGRSMLRNFRPDHILLTKEEKYDWKYSGIVESDIKYGSQDIHLDKPNLQQYQNILMNGGICGRRAFFGRFILRSFGIPTTARPMKGHGSLIHWTPPPGDQWVPNLGPGFGSGWTNTQYLKDLNFQATTQARTFDNIQFWNFVKRCQLIGDLLDEKQLWGECENKNTTKRRTDIDTKFSWYGLSLKLQRSIIDDNNNNNNNNNKDGESSTSPASNRKLTIAERLLATPVKDEAISYDDGGDNGNGIITIPASTFFTLEDDKLNDDDNDDDIIKVMDRSFHPNGGKQIYLPKFMGSEKGFETILRGGSWQDRPIVCDSGSRIRTGGGKSQRGNWGFRVAISADDDADDADDGDGPRDPLLTLEIGGSGGGDDNNDDNNNPISTKIELIYIQPGSFVMGGERKKEEGKFNVVEVPKHEVQLTKGYYLGKYPVTQGQYLALMGKNPSKHTKNGLDCPVGFVTNQDITDFCTKLSSKTGHDIRLPTEAEWEYAARAGTTTKWFFGDKKQIDQLNDYGWYLFNSHFSNGSGKPVKLPKINKKSSSHPVGTRKPNPWGLSDMYGNVWERVSDKYNKDYYSNSPKVDPTGPIVDGTKSHFGYKKIIIPQPGGLYELTSHVVTVNCNQRLNVSVVVTSKDDGKSNHQHQIIEMPFTNGEWQNSHPVQLHLEAGEITLHFWRDKPPQYGLTIKHFTLTPIN